MNRTYVVGAALAACLMSVSAPASAAANLADQRGVFTLTQISGPKVGKLVVGYAVVAVDDLQDTALVGRVTKAMQARLPFKKSFKLKRDTCAIMAVAKGKKGVRLRLTVTANGSLITSKRGQAPYYVHCYV